MKKKTHNFFLKLNMKMNLEKIEKERNKRSWCGLDVNLALGVLGYEHEQANYRMYMCFNKGVHEAKVLKPHLINPLSDKYPRLHTATIKKPTR